MDGPGLLWTARLFARIVPHPTIKMDRRPGNTKIVVLAAVCLFAAGLVRNGRAEDAASAAAFCQWQLICCAGSETSLMESGNWIADHVLVNGP